MCVRGHVLSFDVLRCIWMARRGSRGDTFPAVLLFGVSVDARMLLQAWTHISLRWTHCVCVSCCVSFGIVRGDETREGPTDRMVVLVSWVFGVNSCELNVALTTRGRRSLPHVHNKHGRFLSLSFTLYVSMPSAPQSCKLTASTLRQSSASHGPHQRVASPSLSISTRRWHGRPSTPTPPPTGSRRPSAS